MSRNYELMRRAEQEQDVIEPPRPERLPVDGHKKKKKLKGQGMSVAKVEALVDQESEKLVQRLFTSREDAPHAVLFSAAESGAGCSWLCAHTGETLAAQGVGSVCVVDANFRAPSLDRYFDVESHRGLADALRDPGSIRDYTQQIPGRSLWLVQAGGVGQDTSALLNSDRLGSRMRELREEFDYVLIDSPPVNLYADAILLCPAVDGAVLVLESHSTRHDAARTAKEALEASPARLLGAVLNKRTFPIPERIYSKL